MGKIPSTYGTGGSVGPTDDLGMVVDKESQPLPGIES